MEGGTTGILKDAEGKAWGVHVEINHEKISHVNKLLQSMPEKAMVIYERAIRRGTAAGRAQADREVGARYDIKKADLHYYTTIGENVNRISEGVAGYIWFAGSKIPLYRFNISPKTRQYTTRYVNQIGGWRVTTEVSAAENRGARIRHHTAFIATFQNGNTGIFERTGKWTNLDETGNRTKDSKPEIKELWGYSAKDMLDYQPAREAIQERAAEIVQSRIDHELLRALEEIKSNE